jgi:hypothetical protein
MRNVFCVRKSKKNSNIIKKISKKFHFHKTFKQSLNEENKNKIKKIIINVFIKLLTKKTSFNKQKFL